MLQVVDGFLSFALFLLVWAGLYNVPLFLLLWFARKRVDAWVPRVVLALGFATGCGYALWRIEWFDVWRHGVPPVIYLVSAYLPYLVIAGAVGSWVGTSLTQRRGRNQLRFQF